MLRRAAAVEQTPSPEPRDDRWVYIRTYGGPTENGGDQGPRTRENRYRYADPEFENGKEGDDHSPRERFRFLADLPEQPEKALERARWFYPSDGGGDRSGPSTGVAGAPVRACAGAAERHPARPDTGPVRHRRACPVSVWP